MKGGQTGTQTSVTVTGGSTTNVTINMPVGNAASRYGQNASVSGQTVNGGATTSVTVNLAAYSQGSIKVVVLRSGGSTCNNTNFNWTITGGPYSYSASGTNTTSAAGVLGTFAGFPAGAGYSVTVTKVSNPAQTGTTSGVTVTAGGTVTVNVTLNTNTCP